MSPPTTAEPLVAGVPRPEQMYTMAEVQSLLKIGRSTAFELVQSGALGSVRIGRARRVSQAQLDAYIAHASQSPAA